MKLLQEMSELQNIQGHDLPIPVGNLSKAKHDALVTLRASIISWAPTHADPKVIAQPNCDTPNRVSCDCTFWNGIHCILRNNHHGKRRRNEQISLEYVEFLRGGESEDEYHRSLISSPNNSS